MKIETIKKPAFSVIGKEGSTKDGAGFIQSLWSEANAHFGEIARLVKTDETGAPAGVWGAMTDFSHSYKPWENNFSEGKYLAGAEVTEGAAAPEGWTKWTIPGFVYLKAENEENLFPKMLAYLSENGFTLSGAVHDFTDVKAGKSYMLFPIQKIAPEQRQ
ncbi:MAG: GyrI-like domain-containing protein [Clostridia bacterium]|nr:GyrI-like domain-containing protein [Clostridia bacterium]